jgi:hypothetical protein
MPENTEIVNNPSRKVSGECSSQRIKQFINITQNK